MQTANQAAWKFDAIGTQWQIQLHDAVQPYHVEHIQSAIAMRIEAFDAAYSRFRSDSLVTAVATTAGTYVFPKDSHRLFAYYHQLYKLTDGLVTPLIGQTLSDAGYDAAYSLQPKQLVVPPQWDDAMQFHDGTLTTSRPVLLDFGAIGKGYLIDIIAELLIDAEIGQFYINAGGDIRIHDLSDQLRIGLEHPDDPEQMIGVVELESGAICGSAGNRRKWAQYTHILDPIQLRSPGHISAVWCIADDALTADGLTTALYFVKPEKLQAALAFDYCIVYADGSVQCSDKFKTALFQPEEA